MLLSLEEPSRCLVLLYLLTGQCLVHISLNILVAKLVTVVKLLQTDSWRTTGNEQTKEKEIIEHVQLAAS